MSINNSFIQYQNPYQQQSNTPQHVGRRRGRRQNRDCCPQQNNRCGNQGGGYGGGIQDVLRMLIQLFRGQGNGNYPPPPPPPPPYNPPGGYMTYAVGEEGGGNYS